MKRVYLGAGLVIGLALLAVGAMVVANLFREPDDSFSLQRPNAGQARADYLADGTPVWVIGHQDGSVDVLSGFDTHVPFNLGKMLWWCPSSRALDNPNHGSRWDEYGVKLGGPAPAGLASWEVTVRSSRVFLGSPRPAPSLDTPPSGPEEFEREWCVAPGDPVVVHTFEDWEVWDSPTEAVDAAPDRWILLAGELVADPAERRVRLCGVTGCDDSVVAANVDMPPPDMDPRVGPLGGSRFIARVRDGALVDVTRVVVPGQAAP